MDFDCFNISDLGAVSATKLIDMDNDQEDLWTRGSQQALPHCGPLPPFESYCLLCIQVIVFALCHNLKEGVKPMLEFGGDSMEMKASECPKHHAGQNISMTAELLDATSTPWWLPFISMMMMIIIIIIIIILLGVLWYKRYKKQTGERPSAPDEELGLADGPV